MKKFLLGIGFFLSLILTPRAQVYSDVLYFATACAPNTSCTGQVLNPQNVADSNQTNYATIMNGLGVGSSVILEFGFSTPAQAGSLVAVTLQKGNQTLSLGLLSNITVQLFNSSGASVAQRNGLQLEDLGLLSGVGTTPAYAVTFFTPAGNYDIKRVRVTLGGVANVLNDVRVYNAFYLSPATNGSGQICGLEYATNLVSSSCSGLLCSVVTPQLAVDTLSHDDYGILNIPVGLLGVLGNAQMRVSWDTPGDSGQYVGFIVGQNNLLLNLALLGNISVTLHDAAGNVVHTHAGFSTVDLTLLSGTSEKSIIGFYAPVDFVSAQIQLVQLVGLLTSLRVYGAVKFDATPDVVDITPSPYTSLCQGDSVVLTATPGYDQYNWSNGQTGQSITVYQSGTYTLTALDQDACLFYSSVEAVNIHTLPVQPVIGNITANPTLLCNGDSVTLSLVSPFSPLWSTGDTTNTITVQASGTYSVTVTDTNGCESTSDTLTIQTDTAMVSIISADSVSCSGSSVTIIAQGTSLVTWSTGFQGDTLITAPLTDNTFTASVISPRGCTDSASAFVRVNALPMPPTVVGLPLDSAILCNGATQVLTATAPAGSTLLWSTGETSDSILVSLTGDYYVNSVDSNGCTHASDTGRIVANVALIDISSSNLDTTACFSNQTPVDLMANANGAVVWNTGETTDTIQVLPTATTTYSATVTTSYNCTAADTFVLVVVPLPLPPVIEPLPGIDTLALCNGSSTQLSVNGNNVSILWSTGDTTETIDVTQSGNYYVVITDENGCVAISDTLTAVAQVANITLISADTASCAGNPITLVVTGNGTVTWNDGSVGNAYYDTPMVTTTYTATVSTSLDCQQQIDITVTVSDTAGTAVAEPDFAETSMNTPTGPINIGANDNTTGSVTWGIIGGPYSGSATINGNQISYTPNNKFAGEDSIRYVVCGKNACGTNCDTSVLIIRVNKGPGGPVVTIPEGISPNGDGTNDNWEIGGIENYPDNKLTILNRWGDILFSASPYTNNWDGGTNKGLVASNGKLPDGTYYYVLILDKDTKPMRGFVELRK